MSFPWTASRATWTLAASAWLIVLLGSAALAASDDAGFSPPTASPTSAPAGPPHPAPRAAAAAAAALPRKALRPPGNGSADAVVVGGGGGVERPSRMDEGCAGVEDIDIYQAHASSLPSGVPAYKVEVLNRCGVDGRPCAVAGIHVRCGWFSSVTLVDPRKFRRVRHDDCLLNDGRPLLGGETIAFEYANSFPYRLSVTAATCVDPTAADP